jgi:hypothetical protein
MGKEYRHDYSPSRRQSVLGYPSNTTGKHVKSMKATMLWRL